MGIMLDSFDCYSFIINHRTHLFALVQDIHVSRSMEISNLAREDNWPCGTCMGRTRREHYTSLPPFSRTNVGIPQKRSCNGSKTMETRCHFLV